LPDRPGAAVTAPTVGRGSAPDHGAEPSVNSGERRRRWSTARRKEAVAGYLFIAPVTLGLCVFQLYPMLRGAYLSMTESGFFGGSTFSGLDNYRRLFQDGEVAGAFRNSLVYTLIILLGVPLAMAIAVQLNARGLRFQTGYRVIFFLPVVVIPAAAGLVWSTVYNGEYGPLNAVLEWVGIPGRAWLQDPHFALVAVGIVGIWSTLGYNVVLFLAGLQNIPQDMYDAAALDGAGKFRTFRSITVPLLTPVTFFVSVTSVILAMQMFDLMFTMIGVAGLGLRNPIINDTQTVVYLFYEVGFVENDRGYASAIAVVLMLVVLAATFVQFRLQRRWVEYG
jgi:multiple sugar transport system permease protein